VEGGAVTRGAKHKKWSTGAKAFEKNKQRVLAGETFASRKSSDWRRESKHR
jgi:hypothetical protein